jgi:predicted ribosome quality control (RQC) complex YloA/Tae2 family protein
MNLSYFTLRCLRHELNEILPGKRVRRAVLSGTHELVVETDHEIRLLLSASPATGRLQRVDRLPEPAHPMPTWVEHHLCNSEILEIAQLPLERILSFDLRKRDRMGGERRYRLFVELIQRYNNVILTTEPDARILGALRRVGGKRDRRRRLLPGEPYRPPPSQDRLSPQDLTPADLDGAIREHQDQPARALASVVAGLDVPTAESLIAEAGVRPDTEPTPDAVEHLVGRIRSLFDRPPFLDRPQILNMKGRPATIRTLRLPHRPGEVEHVCDSVSEAIERLAGMEENRQHHDADRHETVAALNRRRTSLERKVARIRADLDDAGNAELYRKFGHLLMAGLHRVRPGDASVTLPDVFHPDGPPATIPLNANKPPHENAAVYLKRSRKAEKARPILARRLESARTELASVESFLERLKQAGDRDEVMAIRNELAASGWLKARRQKSSAGRSASAEAHPRKYLTSDGWTVLVGRNNAENDRLTKGSARDDLFFHAQGCPGSHVVLKREGKRQKPSDAALKEAASLAAYWSKARHSRTVPVNCTEVRYVQKPRGAAPGLVTIRNEVTLFVAPRQLKRTES